MEAELLLRRALAIDKQFVRGDHPKIATRLNNLAQVFKGTNRLPEAEPLMRQAVAIDEEAFGAEHPSVAIGLNNLARLLNVTNRPTEAETLSWRCLEIFELFRQTTGQEHRFNRTNVSNYVAIARNLGRNERAISIRLREIQDVCRPLPSILPELERLLGPTIPVDGVLESLDQKYRAENRPAIYFLPLSEPIAPHLDELLGAGDSVEETLAKLDRQYREQHKPPIWFLPLSEPIAPHLDELLGPIEPDQES